MLRQPSKIQSHHTMKVNPTTTSSYFVKLAIVLLCVLLRASVTSSTVHIRLWRVNPQTNTEQPVTSVSVLLTLQTCGPGQSGRNRSCVLNNRSSRKDNAVDHFIHPNPSNGCILQNNRVWPGSHYLINDAAPVRSYPVGQVAWSAWAERREQTIWGRTIPIRMCYMCGDLTRQILFNTSHVFPSFTFQATSICPGSTLTSNLTPRMNEVGPIRKERLVICDRMDFGDGYSSVYVRSQPQDLRPVIYIWLLLVSSSVVFFLKYVHIAADRPSSRNRILTLTKLRLISSFIVEHQAVYAYVFHVPNTLYRGLYRVIYPNRTMLNDSVKLVYTVMYSQRKVITVPVAFQTLIWYIYITMLPLYPIILSKITRTLIGHSEVCSPNSVTRKHLKSTLILWMIILTLMRRMTLVQQLWLCLETTRLIMYSPCYFLIFFSITLVPWEFRGHRCEALRAPVLEHEPIQSCGAENYFLPNQTYNKLL